MYTAFTECIAEPDILKQLENYKQKWCEEVSRSAQLFDIVNEHDTRITGRSASSVK